MEIMIAAEDVRMALSIASRLKREGHRTVSIHHTKHALKAALRHRPDVAIMDLHGAGPRILQEFRKAFGLAKLPVIVITDAAHPSHEEFQQLAPLRIFASPPPLGQLVAAIAELQAGTRHRRDKDRTKLAASEVKGL
jgi:DNA-binding response OmpR family regulator